MRLMDTETYLADIAYIQYFRMAQAASTLLAR